VEECYKLDFARFVAFFRAISDETRQRILLLLEERERCVSELVEEFDLSQPTISRHLAVLKNAGLVKSRREGQNVYYSLNEEWLRCCCADFFCCFSCCAPFFKKKEES